MSKANEIQIGGAHYRPDGKDKRQHWDMMYAFNWDYFLSAASKYVDRLGRKDAGHQELRKAKHYLLKRIELSSAGVLCGTVRYPRDVSLMPSVGSGAVLCDLISWAVSRDYSSFQMAFLLFIAVGELARAVELIDLELDSVDVSLEEPSRSYVDPDAGQP